MSSSLPEAWFVGANHVGKRLCIQALLNKDLDRSGEGVWDIETKYYRAQVAVKPISSKDPAPSGSDACEALVLICDASRESTYHEALDWLKSIPVDPEIRLLVVNKMDLISGGSPAQLHRPAWLDAAIQWSVDECFEYIQVCASDPSVDQQLTLDGEQQGMARVADALKAHMWPGLEHRTHRLKTDYVAPVPGTCSADEQNDVGDSSATPVLDSSAGTSSAGASSAGATINGIAAADRTDNTETSVDGGVGAVMESFNDPPVVMAALAVATGASTDVHDSSGPPELGTSVVPSDGDEAASLARKQAASSVTGPTMESRSTEVQSRSSEREQDVDAVGNGEVNSLSIRSDATHAVSQHNPVTGASSDGVSGSGCSEGGRQVQADAEAQLQEHDAEYSGNDLAADKDQEDEDLEAGLEEFEKLLGEVQGARHNLSRLSDEERRTEASRLAIKMAQLLGIDELSDED